MNPFRATIERLATVGWCSDGPTGPNGEECLLVATTRAMRSRSIRDIDCDHLPLLSQIVQEQYPERTRGKKHGGPIANFNDHEETTLSDVIIVLEKAAVKYDELS